MPHELPVEPHSRVELAQLSQREIANRSPAVGGAVQRLVMDRHKPRVAREVKVGLDKLRAQRHGALVRSQGVLRGAVRRLLDAQ